MYLFENWVVGPPSKNIKNNNYGVILFLSLLRGSSWNKSSVVTAKKMNLCAEHGRKTEDDGTAHSAAHPVSHGNVMAWIPDSGLQF